MPIITIYSKSAERDLQDLEIKTAQRILMKVDTYIQDPFYFSKPLQGNYAGHRRFRVGSYRVIFTMHRDRITQYITVLRIAHRKDIYK